MSQRNSAPAERPSIFKEMLKDVKELDLSGRAQQIAYSILFSFAPLLLALVGLSGLVARGVNSEKNPAEPVLNWMTRNMPSDAADFLKTPVNNALNNGGGFMLSIGGLLALWSARGAIGALMKGLNAAYGIEDDRRGFAKQAGVAIGLTIGLGVLMGLCAFIFTLGTSVGSSIADSIGLGAAWTSVSSWLRWPLMALVVVLAVTAIHYYAPDNDRPFKWFLPGAAFTVVGWVVASLALGVYFRFSGGYEKSYGTFGAVLAFLFFLWVMSIIVLLGGVLNRVLHHDDLPEHSQFASNPAEEKERVKREDESRRAELRAPSSLLTSERTVSRETISPSASA